MLTIVSLSSTYNIVVIISWSMPHDANDYQSIFTQAVFITLS